MSPPRPLNYSKRLAFATSLILGMLGAPLLSFAGPDIEGLYPSFDSHCGPECLYLAFRLLGLEFDYAGLLSGLDLTERGCTLAQLAAEAEQRGAETLAIRVDRDHLFELLRRHHKPLVAICHQQSGHFVVAYHNERGGNSLVDPQYQYPNHAAEPADLRDSSGAVLLVSSERIDLQLEDHGQVKLEFGLWCIMLALALGAGWLGGTAIATWRSKHARSSTRS